MIPTRRLLPLLLLATLGCPRPAEPAAERDAPLSEKQAQAAAQFAVKAAERYLASGDDARALAEAERAHDLSPALPDPHRLLAAVRLAAGEEAEACRQMRLYVEKAGSPPQARERLLLSACAGAP